MVKNGSGQFRDGTLKLTVSKNELMEETEIFACWYKLRKAKS